MDKERESFEGLGELHRTLDDATEILALFVSLSVGQEAPPVSMMEAAGDTIDRLASWRASIGAVLAHSSD